MTHRIALLLAASVFPGLAAPLPALAQKIYTVTQVQGIQSSGRVGVNERSMVAGEIYTPTGDYNAYAWYKGQLSSLGHLPGDSFSGAYSINSRGQIVGESYSALTDQPVLWYQGAINPLGLQPGYLYGAADALNDNGQAAGPCTNDPLYVTTEATLWDHGAIVDLAPLSGDTSSFATAINNRGQVVGISGFFGQSRGETWIEGVGNELAGLGGGNTLPIGINNQGQIVGTSLSSDGNEYAVLWQAGTLSLLPGLPGATYSLAYSINDNGLIVGRSGLDPGDVHAVLWDSEGVHDLNDLIPSGSGWLLQNAKTINERGQIFGFGLLHGSFSAFLLTPK
ncbi:MAG TPA: hypothetical protein VKU00_31315 [Chthonomonadaceae bacterium]|nr:hypothetical protein [Chthonomonadaceae bacterium]